MSTIITIFSALMTRHQREMVKTENLKRKNLTHKLSVLSFPDQKKKTTDRQEAEKKLNSALPGAKDNPETDQMNTKNHKLKRRIERKSRNPKWGFFVEIPNWHALQEILSRETLQETWRKANCGTYACQNIFYRRNIKKKKNSPKMHQVEEDNTPQKKIVRLAENEIVPNEHKKP